MISLIICSRSKTMLASVSQNVQDTIGVPYDIIAIDNSQNKYGICEAYNVGAAQAKFDFLCFMHEDIKFHTSDWGKIILSTLQNPEVGVVGVAGGAYQPKAPAGWGGAGPYVGINVMHTAHGRTQHDYINPFGKELAKIATLDGLWLCCRKHVWEDFKFDSKAFPGFHFYDVDFCTRVATKYTNYLTFAILIEHFSHGTFDKVWMQNALSYFKQRANYLPFGTQLLTRTEQHALNLVAVQKFTLNIIEAGLPKRDVRFCLSECLKLSPFNMDNFYLLKRYFSMK
jgi:glycosyltransferase involved in cell wall biosynthesis